MRLVLGDIPFHHLPLHLHHLPLHLHHLPRHNLPVHSRLAAPPGRRWLHPRPTPKERSAEAAAPQVPAQLALLETSYRFEADGSSRKEVHTIVKINSELGVRQFAHLNFDYNRAFETIEFLWCA